MIISRQSILKSKYLSYKMIIMYTLVLKKLTKNFILELIKIFPGKNE